MESSRKAVESYWRSKMIDGATSDEDKVTPVYKLEEICELLRSSHASIVKEVSEFILKRLEHKSPIVKQKALRLIKYAVGKSGAEFRREMQRHSIAVKQLFHFKGKIDPLKGDALNKAVRDTAHEAVAAIFAAEDGKAAPTENLNKRIQGFGNTNYEMPPEEKKSFLSEVVGFGSASFKQGLSSLTQSHSSSRNDNGTYRSPNLQRSLTTESDYPDRYEKFESYKGAHGISGSSKIVGGGPWNLEMRLGNTDISNGDSGSSSAESKTGEERLLDTIATSGGVRLQPTRDAIQAFLVEASKLDALALTLCALEAILRKKDEKNFSAVASYFGENEDVVVRCSKSPQASLRERANKVLSLLDRERSGNEGNHPEKHVKAERAPVVEMPDLIDTGDANDYSGAEDPAMKQSNQNIFNLMTAPAFDDLLGDSMADGASTSEHKNDDDPFADVSFHTDDGQKQVDDLFSGMKVDKQGTHVTQGGADKKGPELLDIFGPSTELPLEHNHGSNVNDLMAGLSIHENALKVNEKGASIMPASENIFSKSDLPQIHSISNDALNCTLGSQTGGTNADAMFPLGQVPFNIPPGIMFNPAFMSQPINYAAVGNFLAQQQLLATMANFQQFGNMSPQNAMFGHAASANGGQSSPLRDIFNPNIPSQTSTTLLNGSKKEETKAFDFISDHLAAARDSKRVL
ncbi:ENTH domain [Dillenia turbinata]|uniref:ENTH domain n=1 Tax=Dillenia turbinata TaxID=194707 RepID=A0AAN8YR07_9MAGN